MTDYEAAMRRVLRARVRVGGVARDPDEAYRILGADLEVEMREIIADAKHDAVREYRFG